MKPSSPGEFVRQLTGGDEEKTWQQQEKEEEKEKRRSKKRDKRTRKCLALNSLKRKCTANRVRNHVHTNGTHSTHTELQTTQTLSSHAALHSITISFFPSFPKLIWLLEWPFNPTIQFSILLFFQVALFCHSCRLSFLDFPLLHTQRLKRRSPATTTMKHPDFQSILLHTRSHSLSSQDGTSSS